MTLGKTPYTVQEFDTLATLPENDERILEYIGGEIVEVPSNPYVSDLAQLIAFFIRLFLREKAIRGHVTGEAGGYMVAGERYAPDVAYLPADKQKTLVKKGYNPTPPDLAVEVVSSNERREMDKLRIKITNYLSVDTVVWVVKPDDQQIEVHRSGHAVVIYRADDTLLGEPVLAGFKLPLRELFPDPDEDTPTDS